MSEIEGLPPEVSEIESRASDHPVSDIESGPPEVSESESRASDHPVSETEGRSRSRSVSDAMAALARADFLPASVRPLAHRDEPLPIGHGATNSQPWTVRHMLDLLDVQPGDRVLDVGSGSGWTTALLAWLTGPGGSVFGVERVPELVQFGRRNLAGRFPWARIEIATDGVLGWPGGGPYDRILVSAAAPQLPRSLVDQLAIGGVMVIPLRHLMWRVHRDASGEVHQQAGDGLFSFVPLIEGGATQAPGP